jgi:hypothetical protein
MQRLPDSVAREQRQILVAVGSDNIRTEVLAQKQTAINTDISQTPIDARSKKNYFTL